MRLVAALGGIVVILDQAAKWLAMRRLPPGVPVGVIDGVFSLTLVMNPGLAFGMLGTVPSGLRWVVALLSIGALAVLATLAKRLLPEGGPDRHALGCSAVSMRSARSATPALMAESATLKAGQCQPRQ